MSSLTRARSLRKPAGPTALPPRERPKERTEDPNRNVSPSRLPTKPAMRPATSSAGTTTTAAAAAPTRSTSGRMNRPGSASSNASSAAPTTRTGPRRSVSLGKKPAQEQQRTATAPPPRKETHRYPPLSSATRPNSMVMRPTSAGSTTTTTATSTAAARRTTPTHARANSAAVTGAGAARGAAPPTAQERRSRSRPPSQDQTSAAAAAPAAATPGTPKRRAVSADKPPTTPTATSHTPRLNRPASNTRQQQQRYSPSKTSPPKPSGTPSHTQPPSSPSKLPANVAASAETSRLQAELLQLHLLHRDASHVEAQWSDSAKGKLGERFRVLRDAHRELADREAAEVEGENLAALQQWGTGTGNKSTTGLDGKIQALDAVVSGVWSMSEPGGKYARVVRRFERWIERVMDLEEARDNGTIGLFVASGGNNARTSIGGFGSSAGSGHGMEEALFIQDLDPAWTDDCASMTRRLETWQDQLESAGDLPLSADDGGSSSSSSSSSRTSLSRMLHGSRSLLGDMLSELSAMEELRQAALAREEDWIERMNRDDDENDTPRAGAVWRAM